MPSVPNDGRDALELLKYVFRIEQQDVRKICIDINNGRITGVKVNAPIDIPDGVDIPLEDQEAAKIQPIKEVS